MLVEKESIAPAEKEKIFNGETIPAVLESQEIASRTEPPIISEEEAKKEMADFAREEVVEALNGKPEEAQPKTEAQPSNLLGRTYPPIAEAAQRAPSALKYKTKLKLGPWQFNSEEAETRTRERLDQEAAGIWVILSERLGVDPNSFPLDRLTFWAADKADSEVSGIKKIKNILHRRALGKRQFEHQKSKEVSSTVGYVGRFGVFLTKNSMDMRLEGRPPHFDPYIFAHETTHLVARAEGAHAANKGQEIFINEGIARMGEAYIYEALTGKKLPAFTAKQGVVEIMRKFPEDNRQWEAESYTPENAILHQYLFEQKGGMEKFKQLANSRKNLKTNEQLSQVYLETYGEPLDRLMDEAEAWYKAK